MSKRLWVGKDDIPEPLKGDNLIIVPNCAEALSLLKNGTDIAVNLTSVLIEYPSCDSDAWEFIDFIEKGNNYIFSIAVLLVTDFSHEEADSVYLGNTAVDVICRPISATVLNQRLQNAEKLASSVSFAEFARMLKVLPANIYLKDGSGRYVFSSQTWHHLNTGDDPNWTIRGKTDVEIRKDKENAMRAYESDLKILRTGKGTSYIIEENDGEQEFLQLIKEPLFFEDGRVRGIIALINDVTEQELLRRKLREQSVRDQLTGLYNRTYLDEYIHGLTGEESYPLGIFSADCDRLKTINDTYGHMVGDAYIQLCVTMLRSVLPERSVIFRLGGDEFAAFLTDTSAEEMENLVEEMHDSCHTYTVKDFELSVSIGYSLVRKKGDSIIDGIKQSDSDMYRNKRNKRKNI